MGARDPGLFAAQLRRLREAASLTQEELAARAGLTAKAISALERGERRRPYPHTVRALADALSLDEPGRAGLTAAAAPSTRPTVSPAARQPALVGRRRELGDVVAALTSGETRLLTITGPGGVGKTRLALEAAPRVAAATGENPVVVELAAVPDPALVMPTVAQVLGLPQTAADGAISAVTGFLGSRRRLLLLDNLEHVLPAATEIGRLLDACPGVTVLGTSRAPLRISGEQDFPLSPLTLPEASDVAAVEASGAGRLLLERARAVAPEFALTERTAPAIAQICRGLDGLPLALELAAAHARLLGPDALLARLDQAVQSPRSRELPERQSTMRSTLDWSYALLTQDEQTALRRLSVFAGGFTFEAAEDVMGDGVDTFSALAGLVDQSMVLPTGERYRLLEPVRQYAAARLAERGETDAVADRHADWMCAVGREAQSGLRTSDQPHYLDLVQAEHPNLRGALRRLIDAGRFGPAGRLLSDTWLAWALRGTAGEGLDWADRIRSASPSDALTPADRAHLELATGALRYATGDLVGTATTAAEAVRLARAAATEVLPDALLMLGSGQLFTGAADAAESTLDEAASVAAAANDRWAAAHIRIAEGQRLLTVGQPGPAAATLGEAEAMARELASPFTLAVVLNVQATLSLVSGDDDRALEKYQEATWLSAEVGTMWTLVYALPGLATIAARRGQADLAALLFGVGSTTSDASSLVVAFPPDLAFAQAARDLVVAELGDEGFRAAAARGVDVRPEQVPALAEQVKRRAQR